MMETRIENMDCLSFMGRCVSDGFRCDLVLTSPPYNMTKRKGGYADTGRYDVYEDWKSEDEYLKWTSDVFNGFDGILNENRVVLYNFSYSIENPSLPYKLVCEIERSTPFVLIDTIVWKKRCGLPFPANGRRLSRNWEYVFVFVRKSEKDTYENNRVVKSVREGTGQKYYEATYNFVEAANNDEKCGLNQATYSTELCEKLLRVYCKEGWTVYDPFMGTGTTGVACKRMGLPFVGTEISERQCQYAIDRISRQPAKGGH